MNANQQVIEKIKGQWKTSELAIKENSEKILIINHGTKRKEWITDDILLLIDERKMIKDRKPSTKKLS